MAIKGKGKTRSRRVIAAPPRPQIVVRKPPIWRRPWIWVLVGVLAAAGIALGVSAKLRADDRVERRDREIATIRTFASRVRAELPQDLQSVPGGLVVVFPTLRQDVDGLAGGTVKAPQARETALEVQTAAQEAADGIEAIQVDAIVPEEFPDLAERMQDAKQFMVQSFRLYQDVGRLLELAAGLSGQDRAQLLEGTQLILGRAGTLFDAGLGNITAELASLGITTPIVPVTPVPTPSLPPAGEASPSPGESPGPEPSPTGDATPSPTASPSA